MASGAADAVAPGGRSVPAGGGGAAGVEEIEGHFMQPLAAMDFMQARVVVEGRRTVGAERKDRKEARRSADAMPRAGYDP